MFAALLRRCGEALRHDADTPNIEGMIRMSIALLFMALTTQAQPGELAAKFDKKILSVSYRAVLECYPDLEDKRLESTVDLKILKDRIDEKYVNQNQTVLRRSVQFQEPGTGQTRRVRFEGGDNPKTSTAQWESVSASGLVEIWRDPRLKTTALKEQDVNFVIGKGVVDKDETDTQFNKLRGVRMILRRDTAKISDLKLEDSRGASLLHCRVTDEVGVVCTCVKKNAGA